MKIYFNYNASKKCRKYAEKPSIEILEKTAADFFNLQSIKFILFYVDEENENVVIITPDDLDIFLESQKKNPLILQIKSAQNGLFVPMNIEIIKQIYLRDLKIQGTDILNRSSLNEELAVISSYLTRFFNDQKIVRNVVDFLKRNYEILAVESGLSMDSKMSNGLCKEKANQDRIFSESSSIQGPENSFKSFFTETQQVETQILGLEKRKAIYLNNLSEIKEDSGANYSNFSVGRENSMRDLNYGSPSPYLDWNEREADYKQHDSQRVSDGFKYTEDVKEKDLVFTSEVLKTKKKSKPQKPAFLMTLKGVYRKIKDSFFQEK